MPQPGIICLSPLPELQCLTPRLAWVWQSGVAPGVLVEAESDVIRWSIQGSASIPPCATGTIFQGQLAWHLGAGTIVTAPVTVIQAHL